MSISNLQLNNVAPFFIVANLQASIAYYRDKLGFDVTQLTLADEPFFAIVSRDRVHILLKEIGQDTPPLPNRERHEWALWDASIRVSDADTLHASFVENGATVQAGLRDTEYGLREFEVSDADGYILCFCSPL